MTTTPNTFPVTFWCALPEHLQTFDRYQTMAECGFTIAQVSGKPDTIRRQLDWCGELGMQAMPIDGRMPRAGAMPDDWRQRLEAICADYGSHEALWGYYVLDEPSAEQFADLRKIIGALEELDPDHPGYINLFPNYASKEQLATATYREHVERYVDEVKPPLVSYDHYCIMQDGSRRPEYYPNLDVVRELSMAAELPFWQIILATALAEYREPSEADFRWQVWTSLAYGAKGISYFTYWTPTTVQCFRNGIVDGFGDPAEHYPVVRRINRELGMIGSRLMSLRFLGVARSQVSSQYTPRYVEGELQQPIVGGEFESPDGPALILVNDDAQLSTHVHLTLRPGFSGATMVDRITGKPGPALPTEPAGDSVEIWLWLAPGDGEIVLLQR